MPQHRRSIVFETLLVGVLALASSGCASLKSGQARRELVIESSWVRSTTKNEQLGFRRMNRMSPLIYESLVIQGNAIDGLVAYNRKTGTEVWRLNIENGVEGGVELAGGLLYFGASDGLVYCVNALKGKVVWTSPVRAETLAPPTVEKGIAYVQSGADVIYAFDAQTGKQLWLYNRQVTTNLSIRASTRPVVAGDLLLAGFSDGYAVALKKRDGSLVWERKLGRASRFRDVDSTPVVDGANVFISSFDSSLYSLNLETGAINWSVSEGGYVPVTLGQGKYEDRLFYATATSKILLLDKATGKEIRSYSMQQGIATQPVQYKGLLIYGESDGDFVIREIESGAVAGRFSPGEGLVSKPTVLDSRGEAYFISNDANLFALKLSYRRPSDRLPWRETY